MIPLDSRPARNSINLSVDHGSTEECLGRYLHLISPHSDTRTFYKIAAMPYLTRPRKSAIRYEIYGSSGKCRPKGGTCRFVNGNDTFFRAGHVLEYTVSRVRGMVPIAAILGSSVTPRSTHPPICGLIPEFRNQPNAPTTYVRFRSIPIAPESKFRVSFWAKRQPGFEPCPRSGFASTSVWERRHSPRVEERTIRTLPIGGQPVALRLPRPHPRRLRVLRAKTPAE